MKTSQFNELEMFMLLILANQSHGWVRTALIIGAGLSFLQGLVNASNGN